MLGVFFVALLFVIYSLYDTWYVYANAGDRSYMRYKPGVANEAEMDKSPLTSDVVGWITIDGTGIDYPIMQGEDNLEYLNLDPYGAYSLSGSIFLDCRSSKDFSDPYSIIYGHHMEYGKMFGNLDDFLDPDYLSSHEEGTLYVGRDGKSICKLKLFGAILCDAGDETVFKCGSDSTIQDLPVKTDPDLSSRVLALSTCTGDISTTRVVVFAYIMDM